MQLTSHITSAIELFAPAVTRGKPEQKYSTCAEWRASPEHVLPQRSILASQLTGSENSRRTRRQSQQAFSALGPDRLELKATPGSAATWHCILPMSGHRRRGRSRLWCRMGVLFEHSVWNSCRIGLQWSFYWWQAEMDGHTADKTLGKYGRLNHTHRLENTTRTYAPDTHYGVSYRQRWIVD